MTTWQIDPAHTSVEFGVKHLMISTVRGSFKDVSGSVTVGDRPSVEVSIPVATIDTGVGQRDDHLRSADFFDVERYPEMVFRATRVEGSGRDFRVTGDLTIRDITRPVTSVVEVGGIVPGMSGARHLGLTARARIGS